MSLISMLLEGGLIMTIIIGSLLLSDGQISAQKFILALILGGIFSASFAKLATLQHYGILFNRAMSSIASVLGIQPPRHSDVFSCAAAGDIVIDNMDFSYDGTKNHLNVNLIFKENSSALRVGLDRSGKAHSLASSWAFATGQWNNIHWREKPAEMTEQALPVFVSNVQQGFSVQHSLFAENIRIGNRCTMRKSLMRQNEHKSTTSSWATQRL
jgi:ATP-binding cassette subfamily B protein